AVKHGCVRVVISALPIEETLLLIPKDPKGANARVKLMLELGNNGLFALGQEVIVNNDIKAYAYGTSSTPPFIPFEPRTELYIRNVAHPAGNYQTELRELIEEVHRNKTKFHSFLKTAKKKVKPVADKIRLKQYSFDNYWRNNSPWLAEG